MRARDAGILLVSGLAVFLALETGTDFEVKRRWSLDLKPTLYKNGRFAAEHERGPKPIVDDLDGDGVNEVLVATREPKLKLLDPQHPIAGAHGLGLESGEMHLRIKAETTLLSKGVGNVRSGRQAVAMATGYLEPASDRRRHKYVVVLTHDWTVMCFDRHLKLLWESNPVKKKISSAFHTEASIYISPSKLRPFDKGLVIVGGAMEYEDHNRLHRRKPRKDSKKGKGGAKDGAKDSKAEKRRMKQRNRIKAMLGLPVKYDPDEPEWEEDNDEYEDTLHHFNYFAFEGKRGVLRWKNRAYDFTPMGFDHEVTVPQHNYKLELHNQYQHAGEADWRHYRNSVLRTLPHKWVSKDDTRMYTAHFSKNHKRDTHTNNQHADAAHAREVGFFASSDPVKGAGSSVAAKGDSRIKKRRRAKSAKIAAIKDRRGGSADRAAAMLQTPKHANVVVVHRKEGVEVLHLHTGRPLLELPLPTNMVHADINKDGSIDRIEGIVSEHSVVRPEGHRVSADEAPNHCYAWVTTGTPPTHALFNESICLATSPMAVMLHMMMKGAAGARSGDANGNVKLLGAPPAVLTRRKDREELERNVDMLDSIFMMNDGLISSFNYAGGLNWQVQTASTFMQPAMVRVERHSDTLLAGEDMNPYIDMPMMPALEVMHLKATGRDEEHILALGMHTGTLLTQDGEIVAGFAMPDVPTGPVVVADFDRDGYNDIIIQTRTAVTGMSITPQRQRKPLTFLLGGLLSLVFAAVMVHHATLPGQEGGSRDAARLAEMRRRNKGRSTD